MSKKYLDNNGLQYFWTKIKNYIDSYITNVVKKSGDTMTGPLTIDDHSVHVKQTEVDVTKSDNGITANKYLAILEREKDSKETGRFGFGVLTNGDTLVEMYPRNYDSSGNLVGSTEGFRIYKTKEGKLNYSVSQADRFKSTLGIAYCTCDTAAGTAAKVITPTNGRFNLSTGAIIGVKFTNTNTAQNPTLNVNNTGAKKIWHATSEITTEYLTWAGVANRIMYYMYDGTRWVVFSQCIDKDTTYPKITQAEIDAGTSTETRVVTPKLLNDNFVRNEVVEYNHDAFTYNSGFTAFSTGGKSDANCPYAFKVGRQVYLTGSIKSTTAQTTTGEKNIGKVPVGLEPVKQFNFIQQGSGQNRFLLHVKTNGNIVVARYGFNTEVAIPNGTWLNIACSYISAT